MDHQIAYSHFLRRFRAAWLPGQHVTMMGPTGVGKTWLAADILNIRKYAVIFCTKGRDTTMARFEGWKIIDKWTDRYYREQHVVLWPRARTLEEAKRNIRPRIKEALDSIYVEGGWTVGLDDLRYLCDGLGLKNDLAVMYGQVRSHGTSLVASGQRPYGIIQPALDQATHWLVFHQADRRDVDRMAEVSGLSRQEVLRANRALRERDFVWMQSMQEPVIIRRQEG